ncbi:39S ribosomal protein L16, mitochondrial [Carcharodon carcharias]|uniref:39S ribosomal protein L16, mitochondrial n=1 Tax=Carcharodon carcharias TaxID=13397 RepID=UPI001B7DF9B4|nr:39S ribosomal protein L16, mitochondrial [Carcharodon carcharias]
MAFLLRRLGLVRLAISNNSGSSGPYQNYTKVLTVGLKTYEHPPSYDDVMIPEKPKLKFVNKVPNYKKPRRWMKRLGDIRGPATRANTLTWGQYGIVALGGGYLHWGHFEMMRLTINRRMDAKTMFARWRVNPPYKPITRKGLGQRMGGGKGAIDHYVTPVKHGRIIVEFGGKCAFEEVEPFLSEVAKKLPFPAKTISKKHLEELMKEDEQKAKNNQNPWTFERIATMNMMGIRKVLSPFDLKYHGKFCGKLRVPNRV